MITYNCRDAVANDIPYLMASGHFTLVVALKHSTTCKIRARVICLSAHIIKVFIFPSDPISHAMNFWENISRFG